MDQRSRALAALASHVLAVSRPGQPRHTRAAADPVGPGRQPSVPDRDHGPARSDTDRRTSPDRPDDAILFADGAFLQRPELDPYWDLRIYLDIGFDEVLRRGIARDQGWMGSAERAEHRYRTRYIPGERRYLDEVRPRERAQIVVDNSVPEAPSMIVRA